MMLRTEIARLVNGLNKPSKEELIETIARHFAKNYVYLIGEFENVGRRIKSAKTGKFVKLTEVAEYVGKKR